MGGILAGLILAEVFAGVLSKMRESTSAAVGIFNSTLAQLSQWNGLAYAAVTVFIIVVAGALALLILGYIVSSILYLGALALNHFFNTPLPKRARHWAIIDIVLGTMLVSVNRIGDWISFILRRKKAAPTPQGDDPQRPIGAS
jgi:hypothetical protein